jgi:hypothetical protein
MYPPINVISTAALELMRATNEGKRAEREITISAARDVQSCE